MTAPTGERGWLFGTVHALPDNVTWRTPLLDEIAAEADVLVVEIGGDDGSPTALFSDMAETPGQPPLSSRVDPVERPALLAMMDDAEVEDGDFTRIETWAAALMLNTALRIGDGANGVDRALIAEADEVIALETRSGQLSLFDNLSEDAQSDLLAGTARNHADRSGEMLLRAWLEGNDHRLDEHVNGELLANAELKRVLLTGRNLAWVSRIDDLIRDRREPLVAVGAAHMVGAEGLLALLGERGYTIRRIQ